jgi:amidase
MAVQPPSRAELQSIAESFHLHLEDLALGTMESLVTSALASYDVVDTLIEQDRPSAPKRPHATPQPVDNPLNGWYVTAEIAGASSGILAGKRLAIKDNVMVAGLPMMNGSPSLEGFVPVEDATVVTRILAAGGTVAGKAVCEDLCFSGGSHTGANGPVLNPWDTTRSTGGSSSGSAALVASGAVDMAIGGDQGGSVRMPASWCGIVGLKATHGLVPYTGGFPIEATLDHLGPIARTVQDTALLLSAIAGPDGQDPRQAGAPSDVDYTAGLDAGVRGKRVGILREGFAIAGLSEPQVDEAVQRAAQRFAELGADVVEVSVPEHADAIHVWNVIATDGGTWQMLRGNGYGYGYKGRYSPELMDHYARGLAKNFDAVSHTVKFVALCGQYMLDRYHGTHYAKAQNLSMRIRAAYDLALQGVDVLVLPTQPMRATVIPAADAPIAEYVGRALEMISNTAPFDVTGHPAISVPADVTDGRPIGMMIVGKHWDEKVVLSFAHAYESLVGGFPAPPAAG